MMIFYIILLSRLWLEDSGLFIALGSFSLIRLPTFFARLRAFILLMTVGMFFIIIGIIARMLENMVFVKMRGII